MSGDEESKRVQQRNAKDDRFCKIKFDEEAKNLFIERGVKLSEFDNDFEDDEVDDSDQNRNGFYPPITGTVQH